MLTRKFSFRVRYIVYYSLQNQHKAVSQEKIWIVILLPHVNLTKHFHSTPQYFVMKSGHIKFISASYVPRIQQIPITTMGRRPHANLYGYYFPEIKFRTLTFSVSWKFRFMSLAKLTWFIGTSCSKLAPSNVHWYAALYCQSFRFVGHFWILYL